MHPAHRLRGCSSGREPERRLDPGKGERGSAKGGTAERRAKRKLGTRANESWRGGGGGGPESPGFTAESLGPHEAQSQGQGLVTKEAAGRPAG